MTVLHELAHSEMFDEGVALGLDASGYSLGYDVSCAAGKNDEEMGQCIEAERDAAKENTDKLRLVMESSGFPRSPRVEPGTHASCMPSFGHRP